MTSIIQRVTISFIFTVLSVQTGYAQTIETVYPATICDTANLFDDNSQNSHIDKGVTSILGFGLTLATSDVVCPIPRNKPRSNNRVRIDIYLLRESQKEVNCTFRHTARNGALVSFVRDGHDIDVGPTGSIRLTGNFPSTRRNGTFGVKCSFASNNDITLYTFRVREF